MPPATSGLEPSGKSPTSTSNLRTSCVNGDLGHIPYSTTPDDERDVRRSRDTAREKVRSRYISRVITSPVCQRGHGDSESVHSPASILIAFSFSASRRKPSNVVSAQGRSARPDLRAAAPCGPRDVVCRSPHIEPARPRCLWLPHESEPFCLQGPGSHRASAQLEARGRE